MAKFALRIFWTLSRQPDHARFGLKRKTNGLKLSFALEHPKSAHSKRRRSSDNGDKVYRHDCKRPSKDVATEDTFPVLVAPYRRQLTFTSSPLR